MVSNASDVEACGGASGGASSGGGSGGASSGGGSDGASSGGGSGGAAASACLVEEGIDDGKDRGNFDFGETSGGVRLGGGGNRPKSPPATSVRFGVMDSP